MDLDATPYRIFVTVADQMSFTRASQILNVSQPALSARIRELERRLGFALFSRTSRRVELTAEGRLFLANARRMVTEASTTVRAAREIRDNDLRIGAPFYTQHIRERRTLIDRLIVEHAQIRLRVFDKSHTRSYADLLHRELDLALLLEPADAGVAKGDVATEADWPDGLERLCIGQRRLALQIPAEYPWSTAAEVPREALKNQYVAVFDRSLGAPMTVAVNRALRGVGAELVRPPEGHAFAVERYARLMRVPAVTLGWFDVPDDGSSADMVVRPIEGIDLRSSLSLVRLHGEQRPAATMVWEMVQKAATPATAKPEDASHRKIL
jgi:DNA-binding transcriptional LysR family regulator